MIEMIIRGWRIADGVPSGKLIWFDPSCETVRLYRTPPTLNSEDTPPGLAEVADVGESGYLDKVVSMSAVEPEPESHAVDRLEQFGLLEEEGELPFSRCWFPRGG